MARRTPERLKPRHITVQGLLILLPRMADELAAWYTKCVSYPTRWRYLRMQDMHQGKRENRRVHEVQKRRSYCRQWHARAHFLDKRLAAGAPA